MQYLKVNITSSYDFLRALETIFGSKNLFRAFKFSTEIKSKVKATLKVVFFNCIQHKQFSARQHNEKMFALTKQKFLL